VSPDWAGFKIPYFAADGGSDPDGFFRFRYLQDRPSRGWGSMAAPDKPRRYGQPAGTPCGAYLPPTLRDGASWAAIQADPGWPVVLTEGELKAAKGCAEGFPTVGLGGVYNWRSARELQELIPALEAFRWEGRPAYVCFDSDLADNPMVRLAAGQLASTLARRGAAVRWVRLEPAPDGSKRGLDDFLVQEGPEAFGALVAQAEELGPGVDMHRMNSEAAMVRATGEVVELASGHVFSASAFADVLYKPRSFMAADEDRPGRMVRRFTAKEWLAWPLRTEVPRLEYDPGAAGFFTADGAYNTWAPLGWGCAPREGDVGPWERLFGHVTGGATEEERLWLRRWLAWPVRNPGAKLATAVLLWGRQQGTGKTFLGETMAYVYGKNYGTVNADQLGSSFTEWAECKQFIVADELAVGSKRELADAIKDLVTRTTLRMNIKNRKTFQVRDRINYWMTSNHEDAVYLEAHDRRVFVHHVDVDPMPRAAYKECDDWLRRGGGGPALFWHLLRGFDMGDFDPQGPAPRTSARAEMAAAGRGDVEDWAVQLRADPDSLLPPDRQPWELWRTQDLLRAYDPDGRDKVRSVGLARALGAAGVAKADRGRNNAVVGGVRTALWAVRNPARWASASSAEAARGYEAERRAASAPKRRFEQGARPQ